jgi:hypothetical protein
LLYVRLLKTVCLTCPYVCPNLIGIFHSSENRIYCLPFYAFFKNSLKKPWVWLF